MKRLSDNAAFNDLRNPRMLSLLTEVDECFDIVKDEKRCCSHLPTSPLIIIIVVVKWEFI